MVALGFLLLTAIASLTHVEAFDRASGGPERPPDSCLVTRAPVRPFIPPVPYSALPESPDRFWFGTEALWVMPKADGTWHGLHTENGYRDKLFLWRRGYDGRVEQKPAVTISAKRLDRPAPPYVVSRATNAYLPSGEWTMLTGLDIPTLGCWELTAQYRGTTLQWVVWVVE